MRSFPRIPLLFASGKKLHVTPSLMILQCKLLCWLKELEAMAIQPNPSYQIRKFRFQRLKNKTIQWWRLLSSPANLNEFHSMELSWAWEPTYREGAWSNESGKRSICRVYSWNMGRWSKAKRHSMTYWFWTFFFLWKEIIEEVDWLCTSETPLIWALILSQRTI